MTTLSPGRWRLGLCALAALFSLMAAGEAALAQPALSQNARWGRSLAELRCSACHAITLAQPTSPNPRAPTFADLVGRFDTVGLERRLTGFAGDHAGVMPPRELTTDEALFVAAYIESLRAASRPPR